MATYIKSPQDIQQIELCFGKDWKTTKNIQERYKVRKLSLNNQKSAAEADKKRAFSEKLEQLEKWHKLLANETTKRILIREAQPYQTLDNTSRFTTRNPQIKNDAHLERIMEEFLGTTLQNPPQHSRGAQPFDLLTEQLDIPQQKPLCNRRLISPQPTSLSTEATKTQPTLQLLSNNTNRARLLDKHRPTPLLELKEDLEKENKKWEQALKKSPGR